MGEMDWVVGCGDLDFFLVGQQIVDGADESAKDALDRCLSAVFLGLGWLGDGSVPGAAGRDWAERGCGCGCCGCGVGCGLLVEGRGHRWLVG